MPEGFDTCHQSYRQVYVTEDAHNLYYSQVDDYAQIGQLYDLTCNYILKVNPPLVGTPYYKYMLLIIHHLF